KAPSKVLGGGLGTAGGRVGELSRAASGASTGTAASAASGKLSAATSGAGSLSAGPGSAEMAAETSAEAAAETAADSLGPTSSAGGALSVCEASCSAAVGGSIATVATLSIGLSSIRVRNPSLVAGSGL